MQDPFILLDLVDAYQLIQRLPAATRRKGEALLSSGRIVVDARESGISYCAKVFDKEVYVVELVYDPERGWRGQCSCPNSLNCEHIYAAMSTLLAEHRAATVRNLSSGKAGLAPAAIARARAKSGEPGNELARRLLLALGRPLQREEAKFVNTVKAVYAKCAPSRRITGWDFQEMGLPLPGYGWDALRIWPSFPGNEYEFWLYVANAAQERQVEIPKFMVPITDLASLQERLERWRRAQEVEKWKQALGNLEVSCPEPAAAPAEPVDLRLLIGPKDFRLQWKRSGQGLFENMKQSELRALQDDLDEGKVQLATEAELIWHQFSSLFFQWSKIQYNYNDPEAPAMLSRLLRKANLQSRIVNWSGQPLERPAEALRWQLIPAAHPADDYRLCLVKTDGSPPPSFLCVLPGQPPLYLCEEAVLTGPPLFKHILHPDRENRIPAPALERAAGIGFLQSIGVELPTRLRERVQWLPLQMVIHCELQPIYPNSNVEECVVKVNAEAPDGYRLEWDGVEWRHSKGASAGSRPSRAGGESIIVYDRATLGQIGTLLEPLNLRLGTYNRALATRVTKKFPELFSTWLRSVPSGVIVRLEGDLASLASPEVAGQISLDVTEAEIDWFDLRVVVKVSDTTLTPEEIRLLLNAKGGYVRLAGKGWRRLRYDLSSEEDDRLARLGLSPHELSDEPQRLHALQLADEAAKKFLPAQQVEQVQRRAGEIKTRVAPDLPAGVTAQLRPYQLEGFHFLAYLSANHFGGILADDMGLGKTLQTLAWLVWLREGRNGNSGKALSRPGSPEGGPSLVVCPKSVMDNWHAEATRFTPGLRVKSWAPSELGGFLKNLPDADLHVINYSQLRSLGESLIPVRWLALILDEGQYIKNPGAQTAQVARALRAEHRLILSGTPIENRLLDLWSLMTFAMPGVLSSRAQFARLYDAKGDPLARRRLAARVRPFVLRRTKAQVARDLPDRIEEDLFCEIEGEQQSLYRAEIKRAQQLLLRVQTQKELAQHQFNFLTSLLRLRQICCHPRLVKADSTASSAKTEALLEQLEPLMEEGQKVLVFSQFVEMLNLLRPELTERQWPLFYLAGDTENRGELVRKFQSTEGPAVFLISLKAGGFGLNLTAASYVMLFDPWWNPAVENQAIDRTHRIGQQNKVIAYRLLIKNSIEEKIRELQKRKKALAEDILGEERFAQSLTLQDLQFLFAD